MAELITIPNSFFELTALYTRANLKLWGDRAAVVQTVFEALERWGPTVDDVEVRTTGSLSEQGINIKIPQKRSAFFFGPSLCKFTRDSIDWASAEETIEILDTALSALLSSGDIEIKSRQTVIALHFQPRTAPFMQILWPFIAPQLAALEGTPARTMATVAKWDDRKITLDGSGSLANGVFVRLERTFEGSVTYEEIARQLRADEEVLFGVLGVEEDLS